MKSKYLLRTYRNCERDRVDQFQDEMEGQKLLPDISL